MLNVIDIHSKYASSIPLKDKTGKTVLDAFKQTVQAENLIWVDEGKETHG